MNEDYRCPVGKISMVIVYVKKPVSKEEYTLSV
jgi:hypothetical protein